MADKDEDWSGPVIEASKPLDERVETLEVGLDPVPVVPAEVPIEERIARLERIAEYLHEGRLESSGLAESVDMLVKATQSLTERLTAIEERQKRQNDYEHNRDEEQERRRGR